LADNRFPDINFVDTDATALTNRLVASYEAFAGKTLHPATPERLFIMWLASILLQDRALFNDAARQNLPRFARGEMLDSLGELYHGEGRLAAKAATTTIRFTLSTTQLSAVLVPQGTRVTTADGTVTFATTKAAYIDIGSLYVDVPAACTVTGESGNGFVAGQISEPVDVFPFLESALNITTSEGGSDAESDEAFYERLRESEDAYSTAGSIGAYKYHARSANAGIADVAVTSPADGEVNVYILMQGGELPGSEVLEEVEAALSADDVRPLTDSVTVSAPSTVAYNIEFTYYVPTDSPLAGSIEEAVLTAVNEYKTWQSAKMGRDINPSKLISLVMATGVKRVDLTAPVYAAVDETEVAALGTESVTNGGYEDE
jgi:phage-related baseplate assembly protein